MRILVVEDEKDLRNALKRGLDSEGYTIDTAGDGEMALEKNTLNDYDLILLDINLPKKDGFEVCKHIRKNKGTVPIIMLTARADVEDKISGLDYGADDYIEKPFSFREVLSRIEAVCRRNNNRYDNVIKTQDLKVDTRKKRVWIDEQEIKLRGKEYEILDYLMRNKGKIITSGDIFEHVWSEEANPFSKTVKVHISNLRKKIDKNRENGSYIKTVKNRGYLIE